MGVTALNKTEVPGARDSHTRSSRQMMHKVRSVTTDYYLKNKRDGISGREDGATLNLEVKSLN